ncbi:hypothetical protein NMG60_11006130 [Bertholletia excelsa]
MEFLFGENEGDVKSAEANVLSAVPPLLKLLCLTVIGLVLAHPKTQIIPRATFKILSKLVFALFLPCTIFVHLGESITLDNFTRWWFVPVNVIVSTVIGCFFGYLVTRICRPPPEFVRFTVIVTAFGNTGNLPLAIVGSICHSHDNPFGHGCYRTGVAFVSYAQWIHVLLFYTLVYHMMEPPLEYYEVVDEDGALLVEAEWPGLEDKETEHCKTPFIARVFTSVSSISQSSIPDPDHELMEEGGGSKSPKSIRCLAEPRVVRRIRTVAVQTPIRHIFQPPTIATLLAFIIGISPPLKSVVYDDNSPVSFVIDSLEILAEAMVPSVMLVLGGMLAEGPNESRLGFRTTVGIIVARLLVLPLAGIGVIWFADRMNILIPGDEMYKFVLLLQYTTPSAILFGAIASLRGYAVKEASALLFWQHLFALFSISMFIIVYFKLLLSYV